MSTIETAPKFEEAEDFAPRRRPTRAAGMPTIEAFVKSSKNAQKVTAMPNKEGKSTADVDEMYSLLSHAAKMWNADQKTEATHVKVRKGNTAPTAENPAGGRQVVIERKIKLVIPATDAKIDTASPVEPKTDPAPSVEPAKSKTEAPTKRGNK